MAVDLQAATAQSQKRGLAEQLKLYVEAVFLWSKAVLQCEGRGKERAQRNLDDNQRMRASISEQQGAGPQCEAAHRDAGTLQELARQALSERRFTEASMLFRKTADTWDLASERCTGSQQDMAHRRREQSELDSHNAEYCAPQFEKAREQTLKLRGSTASLSREEKQEASQVAETLWREALGQCKGSVLDTIRNNAQAIARERGTPWVARSAPIVQTPSPTPSIKKTIAASQLPAVVPLRAPVPVPVPAVATALAPVSPAPKAIEKTSGRPAFPAYTSSLLIAGNPVSAAIAPAATAATATVAAFAAKPSVPETQPPEFMAGTTRFSGQFVRDTDSPTYSGTGKLVWSNGDAYEGTLVKGQRHGKGVFIWANGQRYQGDWVNDKAVGQASLKFADGNQFEGSVSNGLPQGQGRMRYESGDSYIGPFVAGAPQGHGIYTWKSGQKFEGTVVKGVPNGQGRMAFASGDTYVGQLANGEPEGQGVFTWVNGDHYTGLWKSGKKHGQGSFSWKSGERWDGIYENDQQTGGGQPVQKN
jgi:hypothetical protein